MMDRPPQRATDRGGRSTRSQQCVERTAGQHARGAVHLRHFHRQRNVQTGCLAPCAPRRGINSDPRQHRLGLYKGAPPQASWLATSPVSPHRSICHPPGRDTAPWSTDEIDYTMKSPGCLSQSPKPWPGRNPDRPARRAHPHKVGHPVTTHRPQRVVVGNPQGEHVLLHCCTSIIQ